MDSTLLDQIRYLCRDRAAYERLKAILVQQERVHQLSWEERYEKLIATQAPDQSGSDIFRSIIAREKSLAQLADAIQRSPSLELILQIAVQVTQKLLQVDRVAIFRRYPDGRGEFATDAIATGIISLADMPERQLTLAKHIMESIDTDNTKQTIDSIRSSSLSSHVITLLEQIGISSYAVNKIYAGHQVWGTLVAFHGSAYHSWSESDRTSLSLVASQIGIAINLTNLRLQAQELTQDLAGLQNELSLLKETVQAIANQEVKTNFIEPVLETVVEPEPRDLGSESSEEAIASPESIELVASSLVEEPANVTEVVEVTAISEITTTAEVDETNAEVDETNAEVDETNAEVDETNSTAETIIINVALPVTSSEEIENIENVVESSEILEDSENLPEVVAPASTEEISNEDAVNEDVEVQAITESENLAEVTEPAMLTEESQDTESGEIIEESVSLTASLEDVETSETVIVEAPSITESENLEEVSETSSPTEAVNDEDGNTIATSEIKEDLEASEESETIDHSNSEPENLINEEIQEEEADKKSIEDSIEFTESHLDKPAEQQPEDLNVEQAEQIFHDVIAPIEQHLQENPDQILYSGYLPISQNGVPALFLLQTPTADSSEDKLSDSEDDIQPDEDTEQSVPNQEILESEISLEAENSENVAIQSEITEQAELEQAELEQVEPEKAELEQAKLEQAEAIASTSSEHLASNPENTVAANLETESTVAEADDERDPAIEPQFIETILAIAGNDSKGIKFLLDVIDNYLEETPKLVQAIDRAIAINDHPRLLQLINSLRTSSDYVGALALSYQCRQLESAVRANYVVLIYACLSQVAIETQRATDALRIEREKYLE